LITAEDRVTFAAPTAASAAVTTSSAPSAPTKTRREAPPIPFSS